MSTPAEVNAIIERGAHELSSIADELRELMNSEVQPPELLMETETVIANLRETVKEIYDQTLDEG
jgi:hypothetical protein